MRTLIVLLGLLIPCLGAEETESALDLQLGQRGETLYQTPVIGGPQGSGFFLLKHVFPAGASTAIDSNVASSSFVSPDRRYRLYGTMGQPVTGTSEDTANFRMTSGFFASSRKSSFRIQSVTERKRPIVTPRSTR